MSKRPTKNKRPLKVLLAVLFLVELWVIRKVNATLDHDILISLFLSGALNLFIMMVIILLIFRDHE